jgi:hypothetical protein
VNANWGEFWLKAEAIADAHRASREAGEGALARRKIMGTDDKQRDGFDQVPFWQRKSLEEMTDSEWESLCDGCGRCCLNKLEEEGTDRTY